VAGKQVWLADMRAAQWRAKTGCHAATKNRFVGRKGRHNIAHVVTTEAALPTERPVCAAGVCNHHREESQKAEGI